jgi:hypothetical protein
MRENPLTPPSRVVGLEELQVEASVNFGRWPFAGFDVVLMLGPGLAEQFVERGEFWAQWQLGHPELVRFELQAVLFNRAVFAAVEALPAADRARVPQDALWLLQEPPSQLDGARS